MSWISFSVSGDISSLKNYGTPRNECMKEESSTFLNYQTEIISV